MTCTAPISIETASPSTTSAGPLLPAHLGYELGPRYCMTVNLHARRIASRDVRELGHGNRIIMSYSNSDTGGVLTQRQAADELGVSLRTLQRRIEDGSLPAYRIGSGPGSAVRIKRSDLDDLLNRV